MEITKEFALGVLKSRRILTTGIEENLTVNNVSTFNPKTGLQWTYPSGDAYAIVNVNAFTEYGKSQAVQAFREGSYADSIAKTASYNVPLERANEFVKGMRVDVVCEHRLNKDNVEIVVITSMNKSVANKVTRLTADLLDAEPSKATATADEAFGG